MTSYLLNEVQRRLYDRGVKTFAPWRQLFSCGFFGNLLKMVFERRNIFSFSKNFVILTHLGRWSLALESVPRVTNTVPHFPTWNTPCFGVHLYC